MRAFRNVMIGGFAGGMALFAWGIVSWEFFPWHERVTRILPDEHTVVEALRDTGVERGVYVIPGRSPSAESETVARADWERRIRQGPVALLVYRPEGLAPNRMFRPLTRGLLVALLVTTLAAAALQRARVTPYAARVGFVLGIGTFAWLVGPVTQWAWFQYPSEWIWSALIDAGLGWTIVAFVLAGIVRPGQARQT